MAYIQERYRYRVTSYAGSQMRHVDPPEWFAGGGEAKANAGLRLGVQRLRHERKTTIPRAKRVQLPHDGALWEADWALDYSALPPSDPNARTCGGVQIQRMVRVVEDLPDDSAATRH